MKTYHSSNALENSGNRTKTRNIYGDCIMCNATLSIQRMRFDGNRKIQPAVVLCERLLRIARTQSTPNVVHTQVSAIDVTKILLDAKWGSLIG